MALNFLVNLILFVLFTGFFGDDVCKIIDMILMIWNLFVLFLAVISGIRLWQHTKTKYLYCYQTHKSHFKMMTFSLVLSICYI